MSGQLNESASIKYHTLWTFQSDSCDSQPTSAIILGEVVKFGYIVM